MHVPNALRGRVEVLPMNPLPEDGTSSGRTALGRSLLRKQGLRVEG